MLTPGQRAALFAVAHGDVHIHPGNPHYASTHGTAAWKPPDITALVLDGYARDCHDGLVHLTHAGQHEVTGR